MIQKKFIGFFVGHAVFIHAIESMPFECIVVWYEKCIIGARHKWSNLRIVQKPAKSFQWVACLIWPPLKRLSNEIVIDMKQRVRICITLWWLWSVDHVPRQGMSAIETERQTMGRPIMAGFLCLDASEIVQLLREYEPNRVPTKFAVYLM